MDRNGHEHSTQEHITFNSVEVSPTCRQQRQAVKFLQGLFQFVHLFLLDKSLKTVELLQDRDWLGATGYAAHKVINCPREETRVVHVQQCWRGARKKEAV